MKDEIPGDAYGNVDIKRKTVSNKLAVFYI